jgi:hypothetical protein
LLFDLYQTSLTFLDIEADLTDEQRAILVESQVLLAPTDVPSEPLFACFLDEIQINQSLENPTDLIVNPTFVFESANDFTAVIERRSLGMLANLPRAWVTDPGTEISLGYWARDEFSEILSHLQSGEKPLIDLTDYQTAILKAAKILISTADLENRRQLWTKQIARAAAFFAREKYTTLRGILPPEQIRAMQNYFRGLVEEGLMMFNDGHVEGRYGIHNDVLSRYFHFQLAPLISRMVGETVKPSYVYSATYLEDAILKPHTDRPQCEFTMSFQVNFEPSQPNGVSSWALCLDDLRENRVETFLANGDGLIYKGCELVHYREHLAKGHRSTSIFFHFVPESFTGSLD